CITIFDNSLDTIIALLPGVSLQVLIDWLRDNLDTMRELYPDSTYDWYNVYYLLQSLEKRICMLDTPVLEDCDLDVESIYYPLAVCGILDGIECECACEFVCDEEALICSETDPCPVFNPDDCDDLECPVCEYINPDPVEIECPVCDRITAIAEEARTCSEVAQTDDESTCDCPQVPPCNVQVCPDPNLYCLVPKIEKHKKHKKHEKQMSRKERSESECSYESEKWSEYSCEDERSDRHNKKDKRSDRKDNKRDSRKNRRESSEECSDEYSHFESCSEQSFKQDKKNKRSHQSRQEYSWSEGYSHEWSSMSNDYRKKSNKRDSRKDKKDDRKKDRRDDRDRRDYDRESRDYDRESRDYDRESRDYDRESRDYDREPRVGGKAACLYCTCPTIDDCICPQHRECPELPECPVPVPCADRCFDIADVKFPEPKCQQCPHFPNDDPLITYAPPCPQTSGTTTCECQSQSTCEELSCELPICSFADVCSSSWECSNSWSGSFSWHSCRSNESSCFGSDDCESSECQKFHHKEGDKKFRRVCKTWDKLDDVKQKWQWEDGKEEKHGRPSCCPQRRRDDCSRSEMSDHWERSERGRDSMRRKDDKQSYSMSCEHTSCEEWSKDSRRSSSKNRKSQRDSRNERSRGSERDSWDERSERSQRGSRSEEESFSAKSYGSGKKSQKSSNKSRDSDKKNKDYDKKDKKDKKHGKKENHKHKKHDDIFCDKDGKCQDKYGRKHTYSGPCDEGCPFTWHRLFNPYKDECPQTHKNK
ncbi:Cyst wall protein 1, partial [Aduncisulcus paluster]